MSDLISRKALCEFCLNTKDRTVDANDIMRFPSAEPERKKGKWIDGLPYINSHWWVCSVCHVSAPENHTGYNFCPSCGADMRGE